MAAHKYLGLTSELLRTEKAINDLACHPLPHDFYQRGGMEELRQKFASDVKEPSPDMSSSGDSDYFRKSLNVQIQANKTKPNDAKKAGVLNDAPQTDLSASGSLSRRAQINAGDLHSSAIGNSDAYRPHHRSDSVLFTSSATRHVHGDQTRKDHLHVADFDLRQEVMDCIVKCTGLIQPPSVSVESMEASPPFGPSDPLGRPSFNSSFSSLSLLQVADDASSITGSSSINGQSPHLIENIENEVEILLFRQGDTLVHAGERDAGE